MTKFLELLTDPSSCQLSMSRTCFGLLILAILVVAGGQVAGYKLGEAADLLKSSLLITAGLYGANSVAGAITQKKPCDTETKPSTVAPPMGPEVE